MQIRSAVQVTARSLDLFFILHGPKLVTTAEQEKHRFVQQPLVFRANGPQTLLGGNKRIYFAVSQDNSFLKNPQQETKTRDRVDVARLCVLGKNETCDTPPPFPRHGLID